MKELPIHKAIASMLHLELNPRGVPWTHVASGEKRQPATAKKLTAMGLNAGMADFYASGLKGASILMEVKKPKGSLSKDQIMFRRCHVRLGGVWASVRGVDEAQAVLRTQGLLDLPRLPMGEWFDPVTLRAERRQKRNASKARRRAP